MLSVHHVYAGYAGRAVVHSVDLRVDAGEIVALLGSNGAGKSTLARAISGLLPTLSGEISLDGVRIERMEVIERLRRGLVHVPEGRQIFTSLTVEQNLELGTSAQRLTHGERTKRLSSIWARFPSLHQRAGQIAGNLSGGQQQLLSIARALMAQPRLLILDEPSLGLSPILVKEMFELIAALRRQGVAILLAEQNASMSLAIANRGYVLENGRVTLSAEAGSLLGSADIAACYLGTRATGKRERPATKQELLRVLRLGLAGRDHDGDRP